MGKKKGQKRKTVSSIGVSPECKKQKGSVGVSSKKETSDPPTYDFVRYEDMPPNHKRKFIINDDRGSHLKYIEILCWLRFMGCMEGTVFEEIPNLNCVTGYPLVEVEVESDKSSAKFLVSKMDLYIVAFMTLLYKAQFEKGCGFLIDGFTVLEGYNGKYTTSPWKTVGPKYMREAIETLNDGDVSKNVVAKVGACEVFYVHLAEAARYYPVQALVSRCLAPTIAIAVNLVGKTAITDEDDIFNIVKASGSIDIEASVSSPQYFQKLVKGFNKLSKYWYVYSLTERKIVNMTAEDVSDFFMKNIKSLRCTLGVLCNIELDKVVSEWKGKIDRILNFNANDYERMKDKVAALKEQRKVRVRKQRKESD